MSNCKVIALTNQKGGVGKTTTAVNLGVGLAKQEKRVLLIDADAQANLTMALGYSRPDDLPITLSTIMQNITDDKSFDVSQGILSHSEGVDLLPSNIELSGFEVRLINAMSRERVLKTYVNEVKKNYDYVLIDCMPSLGMITINALAAADSVVIPTQPHYLSAKGLELLLRSVSMVKRQINPKLRMGDRYGRVIFLREYAAYIKDSMVAELCELNRNMMLSVDIIPVPTDEAVREVENRLLGVETNITNWQRKQNQNNNFSAVVPYDLEQQRKESKEFLDDLTTRDQRMMFAVLTMVHTADSKEQLDSDTEALLTTARKHLCQFAVLKYQQMDGLNTVLPFGVRKIDALRTLTTESLAVFIPFRVQEIYHENGVYYGQNVISKNMIIANRRHLLNGNSFILGVSGAGKSFTAKEEMTNIILTDPNADIIIIDPEREYSPLVKAMQGEVIHISATSENHINAMDMNSDYGDGANPVILKSEFILSLCEQLIGGSSLGAKQKSIIDRCTASVYRYYQQGNYMGTPPTLQDFREELLKQDEPEAQEIALAIELFTDGSLNTFAKHTNVDTHSRLICYDILDLGKQLQPIGMLVVLDSILNRITQNRAKGRNTFIFIDEIYLLFQHEYSANFLFTLWKRVRKYGAYCTGITQNVDDLLQSHTARTMLANSEFIIMLNQASTDRLELAKLLNISDLQMSYITNVGAGQGLLKVGSSLVPFVNKFPRNTELYKLMTTKFGEV